MGENQGLEKALEKLAELLTTKAGGALSSNSAVTEQTPKIEQPPNEIKLEGVKNYLSWSRRALLILRTKDLESYVEGEAAEPRDKTTPKWKAWSTTNSLIVVWLLNSLSPTIAASVEILSSAAEVWKTLKKLYSGEGNVMLMAETEERLSELRQEDKSVMEYVAELQHLWADLDHYDPLELQHADCIAAARKWIERRQVMKFLKGLNPEFEGRRAALYHQPSLPTLEDAIAAIAQEEIRLKMTKSNTTTPSRPAFVATQSLETRDCFNCGENGHLSRNYTPHPIFDTNHKTNPSLHHHIHTNTITMSGPRIATRLFSTSSRALNASRPTNPSNPNDPLQAVKNAAKAFKADGKIGEKFTEKGSIGGTIEREVGGPFSSKGAIGKQFTEKGAVGSTGQRVAENVEDKAREQQRRRP